MSTQNPSFYQKIGAALTPRRAASYQQGPKATAEDCLCTYLWDVALAESLLPSIHFLEVVYRNALHNAIGKLLIEPLAGHANWLEIDTGFLHPLDRARVARAKDNLTSKKLPINEANLVDELSLGFWTSFRHPLRPKMAAHHQDRVPARDQRRAQTPRHPTADGPRPQPAQLGLPQPPDLAVA